MVQFAKLRQLLSGDVTSGSWEQLLTLFLSWSADDEREVACEYASQHLSSWPDAMRVCSIPLLERCFAALEPDVREAAISEISRPLAFGSPRHPICSLTRSLCWDGTRTLQIQLPSQGEQSDGSVTLSLSHFRGLTELWVKGDVSTREGHIVLPVFDDAPLLESLPTTAIRALTLENFEVSRVSFLGRMLRLSALRMIFCQISTFELAERLGSLRTLEIFGSEFRQLDWSMFSALDYLCLYETSFRSHTAPAVCSMYEGIHMPEMLSEYALRASDVAISASGDIVGVGAFPQVTTVGRGTDVDIQLYDDGISRLHMEIEHAGKDFWLRDLQSMNGTLLNGESIEQATLNDGDVIEIGESRLVWTWCEDEERQMSVPCLLHDGDRFPIAFRATSCDIPVRGERFLLGRSRDCDVSIASAAVARRHCALELGPKGYFIIDYGSTNGVLLNGQMIVHGTGATDSALLQHADQIVLGDTRFEWRQRPKQTPDNISPTLNAWLAEPCYISLCPEVMGESTVFSFQSECLALSELLLEHSHLRDAYPHFVEMQLERKGLGYGVFCPDVEPEQSSWVSVNGRRVGQQPVFLFVGDLLRLHHNGECIWSGRWDGKGRIALY